ncbi:hypothetical protein [Acidovorax sp. T1]|uniref:hypothetical protein n=1 Tax=Acidovorax sp. T1 TaxID=1858609 RepID=UPI000B3FD4D7|nr:hypothetical protein [Acidovorax sp. T1]
MLLSNLDLLATAPGGVARLRELILTLAVQGKLVPQDPADEPAGVLLQKIRAEKDRLIAEGKSKRDKPLAEIAEEEKPFELPQTWEWAPLGEVVEIVRGITFPANEKTKEEAPGRIACLRTPMARSNSPTLGHPKFPQAGRSDYDDSGVMAMRAAASLRR